VSLARAAFLAAAMIASAAACGPKGGTTPPPADTVTPAPLVASAADAATLAAATEVLAPLGGADLSVLAFAPAVSGLDAAAPVGIALTDDGVLVRWARIADAAALGAALDKLPGAERWDSDGNPMWRLTGDAIVATRGDRVGVATGGAPSSRERVALELAAGALGLGEAPAPGTLRLEVDAAFLVEVALPGPGPVFAQLGKDAGRLVATMTAAPDRVAFTVDARPTPGTLADRMFATANGAGIVRPESPFAFTVHLSREDALAVLSELAPRAKANATALLGATDAHGPAAITGTIALGLAGVSVQFVDLDATKAVTRQLPNLSDTNNQDVGIFGPLGAGSGSGGGFVLSPQSWTRLPDVPAPPDDIPLLEDENTDVPWSEDYREARKAFDVAVRRRDNEIIARRSAVFGATQQFDIALGQGAVIPMVAMDGGYRGTGTWTPRHGTVAATVAKATTEFAQIPELTKEIDRLHAAALAARQHAIELRAKDVAAWDKAHDKR
jgi:predicted small lipoprotein YifL